MLQGPFLPSGGKGQPGPVHAAIPNPVRTAAADRRWDDPGKLTTGSGQTRRQAHRQGSRHADPLRADAGSAPPKSKAEINPVTRLHPAGVSTVYASTRMTAFHQPHRPPAPLTPNSGFQRIALYRFFIPPAADRDGTGVASNQAPSPMSASCNCNSMLHEQGDVAPSVYTLRSGLIKPKFDLPNGGQRAGAIRLRRRT